MLLADLFKESISLADESGSIPVRGIAVDSRNVEPGFIFFAMEGTLVDGARFIPQAVRNGAIAVVTYQKADTDNVEIPVIKVGDPRVTLSKIAADFYPGQPGHIVAVTGTAGKTSVATFVRQLWDHQGLMAASIGTTGVVAPGRNDYGNLTTPDPIVLHRLLNELAESGVSHASMEASSHGLDQHRLDGVRISATGFTNLGRDHLDYHATVEDYLDAKLRLFKDLAISGSPAVIFADDPFSDIVISAAKDAGLDVWTVGRAGKKLCLKRVEHERLRQICEIEHEGKIHRITFGLAGEFQIANGLVAAGLAIASGVEVDCAIKGLETLDGAPGRLELVGNSVNGAPIYVDYAHKPEALENVLQSIRPFTTNRIVLVIGCGGDRDPGKRPIMGAISRNLADVTIITDDNPRTEEPQLIRSAMLEANRDAIEIGDREEAITKAVSMLQEGDCLIVAGKGHEEGQIVGDKILPFNDKEILQNLLKENRG